MRTTYTLLLLCCLCWSCDSQSEDALVRARGMDREPDFVEWFQRREQALLLKGIRDEVLADIFVDASEARLYYEKNPDQFKPLESITVREILL
jgi:hypothetical protein